MVLYCSWQTAGNRPECVDYLWKWACMKETPGWMLTTSSVFTGFLKGMSELTALKLLKSCTPTSRAAASRIAPTSSSLMTARMKKRLTLIGNKGKKNKQQQQKNMTFLWILGTGSWGQLCNFTQEQPAWTAGMWCTHTHIHFSSCFQSRII